MISTPSGIGEIVSLARLLSRRLSFIVGGAFTALVAAALLPSPGLARQAVLAGLTLCAMALIIRLIVGVVDRRARAMDQTLAMVTGQDAAPCFSTNSQGQILFRNAAADQRFGGSSPDLVAALEDHFAGPASVLFRLQSRASSAGAAREDVVTRRGHSRISVHRISDDRFFWRLEEYVERPGALRGAETMGLPMLVANKAGVVLYTNEAMRRLLGGRPKRLDRVFTTTNLRSGEVVDVPGPSGPVRAMLAEIPGAGERREIYLLPIGEAEIPDVILEDFEHVPVALLRFNQDGQLLIANRAARSLLVLDPEVTESFHDLYEGLGRPVQDWLSDVVHERAVSGSEVLCRRGDTSELYHQVTLRRVVDLGRPGVLAVVQDATAMKRLEAQFAQSQKMQAVGQLVGGIAHDFNNLLTAILGHCDLLLLRHDREDPDYADLVQVQQNAHRAAGVVGQLLAYSRKQTLKPEHLDVNDVLSDMTHLMNRLVGERVQLRLTHAADLGPIRADKRQLEQVVMNLVVNARDAMPDGGLICIDTESLHLQNELRRDNAVVPPGDYALIRVADNGTGMEQDVIDNIFEPFFTTKRAGEGTGLGLSTVYGIVKQSGGFIFVDSTPDQGTVFHLYFPIRDQPPEKPAMSEVPVPRKTVLRPGEGVVLLVEDEAPVRAFASRALRMRGFTVIEAENAEQALKALEDPNLNVDVFVTDVVMPGLDGPSWVKRARETRPNVRVVFVSGYAEESLSEEQGRIPNSVFLAKPFSLTDLATTVQGQLH